MRAEVVARLDIREHLGDQLVVRAAHDGVGRGDEEVVEPGGRDLEGPRDRLRTVARVFGVSPLAFDLIEARHLEGRTRDPWQVLGVPRDADLRTVRARWRELVRANHPDKMIARGLPPETVNLANARLTVINHAWEEIAARRREPAPAT